MMFAPTLTAFLLGAIVVVSYGNQDNTVFTEEDDKFFPRELSRIARKNSPDPASEPITTETPFMRVSSWKKDLQGTYNALNSQRA